MISKRFIIAFLFTLTSISFLSLKNPSDSLNIIPSTKINDLEKNLNMTRDFLRYTNVKM